MYFVCWYSCILVFLCFCVFVFVCVCCCLLLLLFIVAVVVCCCCGPLESWEPLGGRLDSSAAPLRAGTCYLNQSASWGRCSSAISARLASCQTELSNRLGVVLRGPLFRGWRHSLIPICLSAAMSAPAREIGDSRAFGSLPGKRRSSNSWRFAYPHQPIQKRCPGELTGEGKKRHS